MGLTPSPGLALLLAGILTMLVWPPAPAVAGVPRSKRAAHRSCRACHQPLKPVLAVSDRDIAEANRAVLDDYRDHLTGQVKPSTRRLYAWCAADFLAYCRKRRKPWDAVGVRELRGWLNRPARKPAKGPRLSGKARISYETAVCGLYRWAYAAGLLTADPMAGWQRTGRYEPPERYISRAQFRHAVAVAAEGGDRRMVLILHLLFGAGLRRGAVAALRIEQVRLSSRVLIVANKGHGDYRVPIGDELAEVLAAELAGRPRSGPLVVRLDGSGRGVSPEHVGRMVSAHLRACEIDETAHGLRHTAGKEIAEVAGIRAAQQFLGHRSSATTELIYLNGADGDAWRGVLGRPDSHQEFEVMGPPRGALVHDRVGGPRGFGLRAHPEPAAMVAEGHEPWRRHQPPTPRDRDPAD